MNIKPKEYLLKILEIIGYKGDKDGFVDKFIALCLQQAIADIVSTLPTEKQIEFKTKLSELKSDQEFEKTILEYFSKEEYENAVKKASQTTFQDYLKSIVPTLNEQQKNSLQQFLTSQSQ